MFHQVATSTVQVPHVTIRVYRADRETIGAVEIELKSPVRSGLFILKFEDHRPAGPQIFSDFKDRRPGPVLNQDR